MGEGEKIAQGWRCDGCGSGKTLAEIRAENPGAVSCCPERDLVPAQKTLLDEFAMAALPAMVEFALNNPVKARFEGQTKGQWIAAQAYEMALDMMEERGGGNG